jgi:hypothetical protein
MRHSRSSSKNPKVKDWTTSYRTKGNSQFFADAFRALSKDGDGNGGLMMIGLIGQRDIPGHTLRTAQSVLRWDARPSLWSHAFLIADRMDRAASNLAKTPVLEVTLHPRDGQFPTPETNGVMRGTLGAYDERIVDANVALLAVKMSDKEAKQVRERAENYNVDRIRYNLWETLGTWQGYLWAQGARPNPLREGVPIFSSSYVEMAYEAINLDLTPGASERNSAPEHLWNAALWWHEAFQEEGHPISGCCVLRDMGCSLMSTDEWSGPARARKRKK